MLMQADGCAALSIYTPTKVARPSDIVRRTRVCGSAWIQPILWLAQTFANFLKANFALCWPDHLRLCRAQKASMLPAEFVLDFDLDGVELVEAADAFDLQGALGGAVKKLEVRQASTCLPVVKGVRAETTLSHRHISVCTETHIIYSETSVCISTSSHLAWTAACTE